MLDSKSPHARRSMYHFEGNPGDRGGGLGKKNSKNTTAWFAWLDSSLAKPDNHRRYLPSSETNAQFRTHIYNQHPRV